MQHLHHEIILSLNADSTEFCPIDGLQHLLAVGTYELDEATQRRQGLLHLYALIRSPAADGNMSPCNWQLQQLQSQDLAGIFDMQWLCKAPARLMTACADGNLHLFEAKPTSDSHQLESIEHAEVAADAMALSLDISDSGSQVITSSSTGMLCNVQV